MSLVAGSMIDACGGFQQILLTILMAGKDSRNH